MAPEIKPCGRQVEVSPDKVLTIRAERKDERDEQDGGQTRRVERQYGVFVRRFQVRDVLDTCCPTEALPACVCQKSRLKSANPQAIVATPGHCHSHGAYIRSSSGSPVTYDTYAHPQPTDRRALWYCGLGVRYRSIILSFSSFCFVLNPSSCCAVA